MGYSLGYQNAQELAQPISLEVQGQLPGWLQGTLLRNGPGRWDLGEQSFRHWFDGLALVHRFRLQNSQISYSRRFLRSLDYRRSDQDGRIPFPTFASDPCWSLFRRLKALFVPDVTQNPNVNLVTLGEKELALTELPMPIEFDPQTLETVGVFHYQDQLGEGMTTAHPHLVEGSLVNYVLRFGRHTDFTFYALDPGQHRRRSLVTLPKHEVSYVHSFGMAPNTIVLANFPFCVSPLELLFRRRPFIENYRWKPERGTLFEVADWKRGHTDCYWGPSVFAFHHVNSFREKGEVVVDMVGYPDSQVVSDFYLSKLRQEAPVRPGRFHRYRLADGRAYLEWESQEFLELPTIDYQRCQGRDYRFVFGIGMSRSPGFYDQIVRLDLKERSSRIWKESDCFPGEPVFVPRPGATEEGDGVLLAVVLDGERGLSYLVVLAADSLEEVARAEVPDAIPFGFHGHFRAGL